jgi:hypothetical protein
VDEPTGFDKNRGAIFGRRGLDAAVRSEAEDERPSPAAGNPTLSARKNERACFQAPLLSESESHSVSDLCLNRPTAKSGEGVPGDG